MKNKNICKFISETTADRFDIQCFVYESDPQTIKSEYVANENRAVLIKQGTGSFIIDKNPVQFEAGDLLFIFEGETVSVISNGCEYMYISYTGNRSDALFRRFGINKSNRRFSGFDGMIPLWHDSLSRASEMTIDLTAEGMLLYAFSRLSSETAEQNNLLNRIIQLTEENFPDPELSVHFIANELNYNAKYVSHFFKEKMNMNYSEYLRNLRIKYAITLFDRGIDLVKNVAALSGFSDPLYFSSVFKKTVGISPKEYANRPKGRS